MSLKKQTIYLLKETYLGNKEISWDLINQLIEELPTNKQKEIEKLREVYAR